MKKYTYLVEILGFLLLLTLINLVWMRDNLGFIGVAPHPYWIVVLALAIKYELRQALTAALISGGLYLVFLLFSQKISAINQLFEFQYFRPVLLFLIFGGLIGQVRTNQNQKYKQLRQIKHELDEKYQTLKKRCNEVVKIKDELSERIIGQTSTVSTVYKLAKKLNVLEIKQLMPAALDFVVEVVGAEKCSFYLWENDKFELKATVGWLKDDHKRYANNIYNELVRQAVTSRKVVTLSETFDQEIEETPDAIEANVVISAPITISEKKSLYGLLNIEKIPFLRFNPDSIKLFSLIADWISHSITLAIEIQKSGGMGDKSEQFDQYIRDNFKGRFEFGTPLAEMREK